MRKAILALTICAVTGVISVTGNAAILQGPIQGTDVTDPAIKGDIFVQGTEGVTYDLDKANDNLVKVQTESAATAVAAAANTTAIAGKVDQTDYDTYKTQTANRFYTDELYTAEAIDKKVDKTTYQQRAADVDQRIAASNAAQAKTDKAVSENSRKLADHETRLDALEANQGYGNSFKQLEKQVDDNRKRASAGIAGVAAMANIPQVIQGQTFAVGAGVGTTDGENALAVGMSARATEHVVVKASVSDDSQQNFVVGAGASYGW